MNNNPIIYTDPTGHIAFLAVLANPLVWVAVVAVVVYVAVTSNPEFQAAARSVASQAEHAVETTASQFAKKLIPGKNTGIFDEGISINPPPDPRKNPYEFTKMVTRILKDPKVNGVGKFILYTFLLSRLGSTLYGSRNDGTTAPIAPPPTQPSTATSTTTPTATSTMTPTATSTMTPTATSTMTPTATSTMTPTATPTMMPQLLWHRHDLDMQ